MDQFEIARQSAHEPVPRRTESKAMEPQPATTQESIPAPLLNVAEAAEYVGVSTKTIYRALESGRLAHARVGQRKGYRIRREWLDDWIDECVVEPEPAVSEVAIKHAVNPPRTARRGPYAQGQTPRRGFLKK